MISDPAIWMNLKRLFDHALTVPFERRRDFISDECGENLGLKEELEKLLCNHDDSPHILDRPLVNLEQLYPVAKPMLSDGAVLLRRFQIVRHLGQGGAGDVYEAIDSKLGQIALKTLRPDISQDPDRLRQFKSEIRIARMLTGPNICRIYDLFETEPGTDSQTYPFVTMEFLPGLTLAEMLRESGRLSWEAAKLIGLEICSGLAEIHGAGIVHSDLKTQNIMISTRHGRERTVIMDFGLARTYKASSTASGSQLEVSRGIEGTLNYMAPEQFREEEVGPYTDIFSLGIILYECVTGLHPFASTTAIGAAVARGKRVSQPGLVRSGLTSSCDDIIMKCIAYDIEERFTSVSELSAALQASTASTKPTRHGASKPSVYTSAVTAACGLAMIATLVTTKWLSQSPVEAPDKTKEQVHHPAKRVLVAQIVNATGMPTFNDSVGELLSISLDQSPYLKMLPPAQLSDVMHRMNVAETSALTPALGLQICKRENLDVMVTGSIRRFGSRMTLTLAATGVDGDILASSSETGASQEDVPSLVQRSADKIRSALGEEQTSVTRYSAPLEKVTSRSLPAIEYYSAGKKSLYEGKTREALSWFQHASGIDPSFAMAYEYIGISYNILRDPVRSEDGYRRAIYLSDRVTERERLKIEGDYYLQIGNLSQAEMALSTLVRLYPFDGPGSINLGQVYLAEHKYDLALASTENGRSAQPGLGTDNNIAEIYFLAGDTRRSFEVTQHVLARQPNDSRALYNLARCELVQENFVEASNAFEKLLAVGMETQSLSHEGLADVAMSQGKYREAFSQLMLAVKADKQTSNNSAAELHLLERAELLGETGKAREFKQELSKVTMAGTDASTVFAEGLVLAKAGYIVAARRALSKLRSPALTRGGSLNFALGDLLSSELEMSTGQYSSAIESASDGIVLYDTAQGTETLARAYTGKGDYPRAIDKYLQTIKRANERTQNDYLLSYHCVVQAYYALGVLYQKVGREDMARTYLARFLRIWAHADTDVPLYQDALSRLSTLDAVKNLD